MTPPITLKNNSDTLQKQLDLVMLTNGWRHFKWNAVLNSEAIALKYYPRLSDPQLYCR